MKFPKQKKILIPLGVLLFLAVLRIIAPPMILQKINAELKDMSPTLEAHVADLDLSLLSGSATLEGISARIKDSDKTFLKVESVKGSVDLGQLIRGNIVVKALIEKPDLTYSEDFMKALQSHIKSQPREEKPLPDIRVTRVDVK